MRVPSGDTQLPSSSDRAAVVEGASSWRLGAMPEELDPADTDDVWPLELWLSREEADSDADTWHAGTVRHKRLHAGRRLRSSLAGRLRKPSGTPPADSIDASVRGGRAR
jgi:hypothetical protein